VKIGTKAAAKLDMFNAIRCIVDEANKRDDSDSEATHFDGDR
jgi:hypothetical protein